MSTAEWMTPTIENGVKVYQPPTRKLLICRVLRRHFWGTWTSSIGPAGADDDEFDDVGSFVQCRVCGRCEIR